MTESSIQHVSDTAFLIAQCRAIETERPDALFRDPLAAKLSGEKGKAIVAAFPRAYMTQWITAIRTVIIDEFIRQAIERGVDTVVNLGAGLDTRPYRLDLPPSLQWIEVDYPAVIAFKEERLAGETPRCHLEREAVDLTDDEARAGFFDHLRDRGGRMIVLTEGVLPYLENEDAGALAENLRAVPQVENWIVDYLSAGSHRWRARGGMAKHMKMAPFRFNPDDWFTFFLSRGWRAREVRYLAEEGYRRGRRVPLPWTARLMLRIMRRIRSRRKQGSFKQFAGYVLLEPVAPQD